MNKQSDFVKNVMQNPEIADHLENAPCHAVVAGNTLLWLDPETGDVHEFSPEEKYFPDEEYMEVPENWSDAVEEIHWRCGLSVAFFMLNDLLNEEPKSLQAPMRELAAWIMPIATRQLLDSLIGRAVFIRMNPGQL